MADVKFTSEQEEAIFTRDENIIVSAQAGAGKTQVLVERIINVMRGLVSTDPANLGQNLDFLAERVDIDKMLIVTFTNKAAQEMKDRIKKEISKRIDQGPKDLRYLVDQANKVTNAQISTMHSFCINTVRTYFHKLDLNPQFKILNEATLNILSWEAMDQAFDELYLAEDEDFYNFLFEYGDLKDDESIKYMLFRIYNFLMSQIDPFLWLSEVKNAYEYPDQVDQEQKKKGYLRMLKDALEDGLDQVYADLKLLERFCHRDDLPDFIELVYEADFAVAKLIEKRLKEDDFEGLIAYLEKPDYMRLPTVKKAEKDLYNQEILEAFKERRNAFKKSVKDMAITLQVDLDETLKIEGNIRGHLETVEKILKRYHDLFIAKKKAKDGIDFSDAEHYTVSLLQDQQVIEDLRNRYAYIFFDEYQDANQVQNFIVEAIKREDNLFFVGDIKQSIYKFRLADPSIFNDRYNAYKKGQISKSRAVDLSRNFRTREPILRFANFIFDELMTEKLGEIKYDDPAHRLVAGRDNFDPIPDLVPVEMNFVYEEGADIAFEESEEKKLYEESNQPYLIAKKINSMIFDGSRPRDFGILLRDKKMIPQICDYLEIFDIPYYTDSLDFTYTDLEVLEYINILKAVDNDKNDLVLMSVLLSVLGNMTEDDLALIRGKDKDKSFYNSFYFYENEDELGQKINAYKSKLEAYRKLEKTMSLYDFAWHILIDSGYMTYLLSKFNGKAKLDNVIAFIEEIKDYEQNSQPGLYNFLNYVDRLAQKSKGDIEPGADLSEEDDVVRIMTIHKSKGLQMKNVILANTEKKFNMMDLSQNYIYHNKLGLALKTYDPYEDGMKGNLFHERIRRVNKLESLSEQARLQYVALTRAEDRLIIFGEIKKDFFTKLNDDHTTSSSAIEWISSILLKDKIADKFKNENDIAIESLTDKLGDLNLAIRLYDKDQVTKEKIDYLKGTISKDFQTNGKKDYDFSFLNFVYQSKDLRKPHKKTVSQLAAQNDNKDTTLKPFESMTPYEEDLDFEKPDFMKEKSATPSQIGTATHFALQVLAPKVYDKESLDQALNELLAEAKISEAEKSLIDQEAIINFYKTEIAQRIMKAKEVHREEAFTMKYDDQGNTILVDGQIDLYFIEDDTITLLDFKTGSMRPQAYQTQFKLYAQALEKATGKKVQEKYIYWTRYRVLSEM